MTNFENLCNEYRENKRMIEELTALNDEIKAQILNIMGDRDTMMEGGAKCTNKIVNSTKLDTAAIKKERPDVYAQYSHETSYKRFLVS